MTENEYALVSDLANLRMATMLLSDMHDPPRELPDLMSMQDRLTARVGDLEVTEDD